MYSHYENSSNPEEGEEKTINDIVDSYKSRVNLFKIMCVDLLQYVQKNTLHNVNNMHVPQNLQDLFQAHSLLESKVTLFQIICLRLKKPLRFISSPLNP